MTAGSWDPQSTSTNPPEGAPVPSAVASGASSSGLATAGWESSLPAAVPTSPPTGFPPLPGTGAYGAGPHEPTSPLPIQPPRLVRPDTAATSGYWPTPPAQPPSTREPMAAPASTAPVRPSPGWGWRSLIAFLAGGLLAGGGFTAAQLSGSDATIAGGSTSTAAPVSVSETAASTASGSTSESIITAPAVPVDPDQEPAAYVAQVLSPSVVQIETELGIGSGVIYTDHLIMTNNHVIEGATQIRVILNDGRHLVGQLVGSDIDADIAVVSVPEGQNLTPATLATGEKAQVGQIAVAIGSPFKLQQTVTEGIVSAVDRPVPTGRTEAYYTAMIQTDAPINPGNSGGALADRQGRVIGINSAIQNDGTTNTNAGIGFAIPIDTALSVADRLVAGLPIERGLLGVKGMAAQDGSAGVQVIEVTQGSGAEAAGIQVGDLIISLDEAPVTEFNELAGLVLAHPPGDVVQVEIVRNGEPSSLDVTLGQR